MLSRDDLHGLATARPSRPVVSVYARTDPRDPANTRSTPAWRVALRNGLAAIAERLGDEGSRDERLAFRSARERIEEDLAALEPAERARSVAWFLHADGETLRRFALQLPVRRDLAVWDSQPYVSPLVDVADRGAPTGVLLVSGDAVRLAQVEQGEPSEPPDSIYELTLGDWRPYGGSAGGGPARGRQTTSHQERFEARVEAQRDELFETAATAVSRRLRGLGWERVVLVSEGQVATRFRDALPAEVRELVVAEIDRNLTWEDLSAVSETLEPLVEAAWLRRAVALSEQAGERARAGGAATLGAQETLGALAEGRVAHLVLDPDRDLSADAGAAPAALDGPSALLGERAVEAAIATGAAVTALPESAAPALGEAGGIVALLRY